MLWAYWLIDWLFGVSPGALAATRAIVMSIFHGCKKLHVSKEAVACGGNRMFSDTSSHFDYQFTSLDAVFSNLARAAAPALWASADGANLWFDCGHTFVAFGNFCCEESLRRKINKFAYFKRV